ncbi:MAG TPA: hypothetical protein VGH17_06780 [Candidatus Acidoferrales bacterium]
MTAEATGRELGMASKSTAIEISAICGLFMLLALWGVVWDITSGLLTSGIDGIMLLFVCAMMAGIFFLIMLMELTKSGILPTPAFLRPAPKPAAAPKAPAAVPAVKAAPAATPGASPAAAASKPPSAPAAVTPGAPPIGPRPVAPAPATPAPGKPAATAPAAPAAPTVPPTVPEK